MKILLSWSSGKDSAWTLHVLDQQHPGAVQGLLTTTNGETRRAAMHGVADTIVEAQARAAGRPLTLVPLPYPCSNEQYDACLGAAVRRARDDGYTHVAFGDLFLRDVRQYRESRLAGTGLDPLFPLWDLPTTDLARDMLRGGLRAVLSCVDTQVLDAGFAGREFDAALIEALPPGADPCGEHGEFHTCVYDGPMFRTPLALTRGELVTRDRFVWRDLQLTGD